jgi:hypothetical protein
MTQPWQQDVVDRRVSGQHRIKFRPPHGQPVDVTYFRGVPVQLTNYQMADPFGPSVAQLAFPQISMFDRPGGPGLEWLTAGANVEILWQDATDPTDLTTLWEGYTVSLSYSQDENDSQVSLQCKGALFQADNFLAYPQFPPTPIPYELLIRDGLNPVTHPSLRTAALRITFPPDWTTKVPNLASTPSYLKPWGVKQGDKWTGITTRSTGSWNKMLTGQIQALLSLMYTADGSQWTVMLNPGRKPELRVRKYVKTAQPDTVEVTVGQPGVSVNLTEDWSQAANVYFGQGTDTAGVSFSNAVVSGDGSRTSYSPFAALRQVHPATSTGNRWFDPAYMRQETYTQFDQGLSPAAAAAVANSQLARSAHPGFTGSVTLKLDPLQNGATLSRFRIVPGMTMLIHGFRGALNPLLVHIAQVNVNPSDGSVELTVDSKFRDLLTIQQVRARSRDTLATLRALKVGSFSPVIQDLRKPWSYTAGSGIIPSSPGGKDPNARDLFMKYATGSDVFPWTNLTTKYPPRTHQRYYIRIGPASANYTNNWSKTWDGYAIPCLFAQVGTIRLIQVAAYDENGNVMPIRFHLSFYTASGINPRSMPLIPGAGLPGYLAALRTHVGQPYPFFPGAFESVDPNGAPKAPGDLTGKQQSFVIGWGNYYQGAGYYPGLQSDGASPTGLLEDEASWSFDTTSDPNFQQRPSKNFPQNANAGLLFVMIYAESNQSKKPVYFLGRCFRQEPGSG